MMNTKYVFQVTKIFRVGIIAFSRSSLPFLALSNTCITIVLRPDDLVDPLLAFKVQSSVFRKTLVDQTVI